MLRKIRQKSGGRKTARRLKDVSASDVAEAYAAGQIMFGENRVQELETKAPLLPQDIKWHLIGHLQSNKAAKACEFACMIHSVDSEKLIAKLNANAKNSALSLEILLELNVTGEESKAGLRLEKDIFHLAGIAAASDSLRFAGLMTMPKPTPMKTPETDFRRIENMARQT